MSTPVMVTERLSVVRYNVLICDAGEFLKAGAEVEDLIMDVVKKVYANCVEYGQKPWYVALACDEGTFILKQKPHGFSCIGMPGLAGITEVEVEAKSYVHKFATFVKELVTATNNNPLIQLKFANGYVGSNP